MKSVLFIMAFFMLLVVSACMSQQALFPAQTDTPAAEPILIQSDTAVSSTSISVPSESVPLTEIAPTIADGNSSAGEVTMADNGSTLNMNVGDSFLLHLDGDFYDWTVEVDDPGVLSRKLNVAVINGAQGIYEAHAPGTAILTASGNPKCLNSRPACLAPSVIFTITVIVQ